MKLYIEREEGWGGGLTFSSESMKVCYGVHIEENVIDNKPLYKLVTSNLHNWRMFILALFELHILALST